MSDPSSSSLEMVTLTSTSPDITHPPPPTCLTCLPLTLVFVALYLIIFVLLNLLCPTPLLSPFPSNSSDPVIVIAVYCTVVVLAACALYALYYYRNHGAVQPSKKPVLVAASVAASVYLLLSIPAYFGINMAMYPGCYFPSTDSWLAYDGDRFDVIAEDGHVIPGMYERYGTCTPDAGVVPIVFFGGNGGNIFINTWDCHSFLLTVPQEHCYVCYSMSYRGFPPSEGTPSERNIVADSLAFYARVKEEYGDKQVVLFAHSLGTGAASAVAGMVGDELACACLAMPFSTMTSTALEYQWYGGWPWMWLGDTWDSVGRIKDMGSAVPLMVLSGGLDSMIAPRHQTLIYESAGSSDKALIYDADARHGWIDAVARSDLVKYTTWFDKCLDRVS